MPGREIEPAARKKRRITFPWSKPPEERMVSEIRDELQDYRQRCEALREESRQRLQARDAVRAELSEANGQIRTLQMEGISLLGDFSAAMSAADNSKLREAERGYKNHSSELGKAEKRQERLARKLETVEVEDEEAARKLREDISAVLNEYSRRVQERQQWLTGLAELLEDQREELGRSAASLAGEDEPRRSQEELPPAEEPG
ncbi:MAG: hypothetical protein WA990_08500 [Rubrobacteraceae bacterium]